MTIAPTLTTMATNNQSQQTSNYDNPAREGSPSASTYWAKTYGGTNYDYAFSVQQTSDGGYIVAGATKSFDVDAHKRVWVLKLDSTGSVTWQKAYGGSDDAASSVEQTADGGYIVAGTTHSFGAGSYDAWVLKLDPRGSVMWQKTYGGSDWDAAYSIEQTADGGYIVAGETFSFGAGYGDVWVLKLNPIGGVTWQKTYGGDGTDAAYSVQQTGDNGYIVAGYTISFVAGIYVYDAWLLKLNSIGGVTWQKTYGGSDIDSAYSIEQTADGGYIVAGWTRSFGAGNDDAWVLKLNPTGSITWQKTCGSSYHDYAHSVQQTSDGGYMMAGYIATGYNMFFEPEDCDAWLVKLGGDGDVVWNTGSSASTHTTSVTPSDSNATTSTTPITTANSKATVQDTRVTPQDTQATITVQSGGGTSQEISMNITLGGVAVAAIVVLLVTIISAKMKKTSQDYA
jgi:uncharacterized delta-60 repeat protein